MRFRTHDLLMATLLAACYLTMAGTGLFGTPKTIGSLVGPGAAGVTFMWLVAFANCRPPANAGMEVCRLRSSITWMSHVGVAAALLCVGILLRALESNSEPDFTASLPLMFGLQAYAMMSCVRTSLHENGLVVGGVLQSLEDNRFEVIPDRDNCRLAVRHHERTQWWRLLRDPRIPEDRVEEVRAFLAEEQPSAEEDA